MTISVKRFPFTFIQTVTLCLLFLGGMNVASKYYYFCFAAMALFLLTKRRLAVDWNIPILLVFSVSWLVFSPDLEHLSITTILKPFLYPMAYLVGRNFFLKGRTLYSLDKRENDPVIPVVVILSLGPFAHYMLNYISGIGSSSRNTVDIWSGAVLSATGQAALACMMIGVAIAALFMPGRPFVKIAAVLSMILMLLYNMILAGRTLLLIMVIVTLACSVYCFFEYGSLTKRFKRLNFFLGIVLLVYVAYSFNWFDIKDTLESSNIYLRFINKTTEDFFTSTRLELKWMHLEQFETAVWGGCEIRYSGAGYAHDLFLDSYDEAGIFALIALVVLCVRNLFIVYRTMTEKRMAFPVRLTLIAVYMSMYLEFFVEPIIQGMPWLFVCFCFIYGLNVQQLNCIKVEATDE